MKIKKLEIVGFKSFVDRTVLHFDHDVTGIVGPNGCGKSNVVDAIKWVMGEQTASRLRGKSMDDVIFSGSEQRGPHGFAEVAITFDNTDGLTPPAYREYAEITVSRRLDRAGRSDYAINKTPVRLMDVTNLFLGTGVGRRAYSIIEQGRIGYIVSSKPEDRRHMIEEAAGITKFKVRKRAAERKMDQTRQNLTRVRDILGELERTLASLKRQAQKAARYKQYRAEVRDLELYVAALRFLELHGAARVVREALQDTVTRVEQARAALQARETEVEADRLALQQQSQQVEAHQAKSYEYDNRVRMLEGEIQQRESRLQSFGERKAVAARDLNEALGQRVVFDQEHKQLTQALVEVESAETEATTVLNTQTDELERRRALAEEAQKEVHAVQSRVGDARTQIARAEAVVTSFERRREDTERRAEKLHDEQERITAQRVTLAQERQTVAARLEGLRNGRQQTVAHRAETKTELVALREQLVTCEDSVEALREDTSTKRSRLRSLTEVQQRLEGVGAGVRALMTQYASQSDPSKSDQNKSEQHGVLGLVADHLEAPEAYTRALAGVLGDALQHVVVDNVDNGLRAVEFLRTQDKGRATVIPRHTANADDADTNSADTNSADTNSAASEFMAALLSTENTPTSTQEWREDVVGPLMDVVRVAPENAGLLNALLADVVVVKNLDTAIALRKASLSVAVAAHAAQLTFVTLEGETLQRHGWITGGANDDSGAHMLAMKREIRALQDVVPGLEQRLQDMQQRQNTMKADIAQRQAELDAAKSAAHDVEIAMVKAEKDLRRADEELGRLSQRAEAITLEKEDVGDALAQTDEEEGEARDNIDEATQQQREAEDALAVAQHVHQEHQTAAGAQQARVTDIRVRAAQARERAESHRQSLVRVERSLEELTSRQERLRAETEHCALEESRTTGEVVTHREQLKDALTHAVSAQDALSEVRISYDAAQAAMLVQEEELRGLRQQIDVVSKEENALTLQERELSIATQHLLETARERHDVDLPRILGDYHDRPIADTNVRARIDELHRLIGRMGHINLMAIEEYDEKSTRYETLNAQRTDLEEALGQLERAIRQMNRESRGLFREAFVAINERFKRIFPQLFRGGKAELRLTNPEDLLETGIDILAQPPGKRLGSLELMSGGEKALTAVAMIFAIFQYKPSPFCLLDEVDAPLDEANISRFAQAIRQMTDRSQFIVITHSKRTMEFTDVLYGVTMEQPGVSKLVAVELTKKKPTATPTPQNNHHDPTAAVA